MGVGVAVGEWLGVGVGVGVGVTLGVDVGVGVTLGVGAGVPELGGSERLVPGTHPSPLGLQTYPAAQQVIPPPASELEHQDLPWLVQTFCTHSSLTHSKPVHACPPVQ